MQDITEKLIKNYTVYHKIFYVFMVLLTVLSRVMKFTDNTPVCVTFATVVFAFALLDSVFYHMGVFKNMKFLTTFRLIEITTYSIFVSFVPYEGVLLVGMFMILFLLALEFIILGSHYDKGTILVRKMMLLIPMFINLCLSLQFRRETFWFCYVLVLAIFVVTLLFVTELLEYSNDAHEAYYTQLVLERNDIQDKNAKLEEYQEKVKNVNERVNYQKIELARVVNDLEQANREIESQTEIMRYMASSFDINKNINVIVDAIMDVKNPKLCAVYMDGAVNSDNRGICIIKTDYASMERRLRKDFEKIYSDFAESRKTTELLVGDELKELRFIGETNIKSLVKLAMINDNKQYGMMLIASNEENFFDKGISYYETCLVEYNVSVKSTKLYLQTQDMARKDGLTQIYNRVYFGQLFAAAAEEATKKQQPLSVALFDIDKFKNINDTYGHLAGDKVIKMVASIDDKFARAHGGFACRYGGEEFLLVLPGYDETQALPILEEMHKEIQTTIVQYDDKEIPVNVCIGLSAYPTICRDTNILVNRADKSMYYGKKHGRGRLVVDNPAVDDMQS
jgi:diguanylate cyclase (GGDEF)-like protein